MTAAEWDVLWRSVYVALAAVGLSFPVALPLAYALARRQLRGLFLVENLVQLPLVLPPVVTGFLLLLLFSPETGIGGFLQRWGLEVAFTWVGAAIAAAVVGFPLMVQTMRVAFAQIDPEWEEAGYVYGGTKWAVFRWVTLPLARSGIIGGVLLGFARALGEFGATIVLAGNIPGQTQTIPLAIFTRLNQIGGEPAVLRLVLISIGISALSLLGYTLLQRRLRSG